MGRTACALLQTRHQHEFSNNKKIMTEAAAAPKAAPKAKKAAAKPKKPSAHPPSSAMVKAAIKALADKKGSSLAAIKKYVAANYKVDIVKISPFIRKALKKAVVDKALIQVKGSYKLAKEAKKPKAPKKAKKPAAKKPKSPKKAAAKPKKAKTPKKAAAKPKPAKKPAAKKTPAKKAAKAKK